MSNGLFYPSWSAQKQDFGYSTFPNRGCRPYPVQHQLWQDHQKWQKQQSILRLGGRVTSFFGGGTVGVKGVITYNPLTKYHGHRSINGRKSIGNWGYNPT